MGIFDWKHWIVILVVVVLVFGTKKLKNLGTDVGESIKGFRKAMNDVNATCINQMYASLNDFWAHVGLAPLDVGETVGWTSDHLLELEFVYVPAEDGRPCMAVSFKRQPKMDYYRIF